MFGIRCSLEDAFIQLLIHFLLFVLFGLKEGFEFLHVASDRVRGIAEAERNQVSISHAHDCGTRELSEGATIDKFCVSKVRIPIEVVVDGVINTASTTLSAKSEIQSDYSSMAEERLVIGTATQCSDAELATSTQLTTFFRSRSSRDPLQTSTLPYRKLRLFRILDISTHIIDESLEAMIAGSPPESATIAVGVYVHHGMLAQFLQVGLDPFGGAKQAWLLAVPHTVDDGSFRLPTLFKKFSQSTAFFQNR